MIVDCFESSGLNISLYPSFFLHVTNIYRVWRKNLNPKNQNEPKPKYQNCLLAKLLVYVVGSSLILTILYFWLVLGDSDIIGSIPGDHELISFSIMFFIGVLYLSLTNLWAKDFFVCFFGSDFLILMVWMNLKWIYQIWYSIYICMFLPQQSERRKYHVLITWSGFRKMGASEFVWDLTWLIVHLLR